MRILIPLFLASGLAGQVPADISAVLAKGAELRPRIAQEAKQSGAAYRKLADLCDLAGNRLSGSPGLARAVALVQEQLRAEGLTVWTEPVKVPHWVRGRESAEMTAPLPARLGMLGIGSSVGTPRDGITAEVLVVGSFEELEKRSAEAKGRIVLFDAPYEGYGKSVAYRVTGASRAARHGAVACLIRSVGSLSYDTPHTGTLIYDAGAPKIPAAALTTESALQIHRLADRGRKVVVTLKMEARMEGEADSFNVVAELKGREKPDEIVLVGGHLDSWDVGQGAQDDGVGCVLSMESAAILKRLQIAPRRTVRVVLFTNEENGAAGGRAYAARHKEELARHVAVIESDAGNGLIHDLTFDLQGNDGLHSTQGLPTDPRALAGLARFQALAPLLAPLGVRELKLGGSGTDVGPSVALGVPGIGVGHDLARYFDVHHTQADTLDKVDRADLAANSATLATFVWALAELEQPLMPAR
ncbi:MAG TPA: M20/M25/M40 family metallo-hydrolase [Holophagaceae bacterium]|nr:M20/M25/M40 family metallo-hydrolase [Holophagaceae bacterium]